jgi:DNA-directed RNA polymerase specialized sigma24 family protein
MNSDPLSPIAKQIFGRMKEAEWQDLRNRLVYFAYRNYAEGHRNLGYHLDELVQDAIVDVITGVRQWPPVDESGNEKQIDLFVFLCQTVRSKVSHVAKKKAREIQLGNSASLDLLSDRLSILPGSEEDEPDRHVIYAEFSHRLLNLVSDDAMLTKIVQLLIDTPDLRPKEIAPILGLSIQEMRNAQKRLSRKLKTLKEERDHENT